MESHGDDVDAFSSIWIVLGEVCTKGVIVRKYALFLLSNPKCGYKTLH
jgi:hypothetical protein